METSINKESSVKKENSVSNSAIRHITKNQIKNNLELNLAEGTEAYYSERYGWTLRRTK